MGFYGGKVPTRISGNLNVVGITSLGFFTADTQTVERDTTLSGNRTYYSVNKNLEFENGTILTVGSGSTIILDRFNNLDDVRSNSLISSGIITALTFNGTLKGDIIGITTLGFFSDDQIIYEDVELGDNTKYYSVHKNITVDSGSTFTVGTGSTILLDRFNNLDDVTAKSVTSPFIMSYNRIREDFTVPTNYNAISIGPSLTVDDGIVIIVEEDANWSIIPGS